MEFVSGALSNLLPALAGLLSGEYDLQNQVELGIRFLQAELESIKAELENIKTPADKLPPSSKIWARDARELSYDIEDKIDIFMVQVKGKEPAQKTGLHEFLNNILFLLTDANESIKKLVGSLVEPNIQQKLAADIREAKRCITEVNDRRKRYKKVIHTVPETVKLDLGALWKIEENPVGIDEARDEVIKILQEGNGVSNKIVSIVGLGGLGKTTLTKVIHEQLKEKFDCSAFLTVSQTPDVTKLLKGMFSKLGGKNTERIIDDTTDVIIDKLREFLQGKRYLVIIDDIWDISHWKMIRCALPDDSVEYRIITTTRFFKVAKEIGGPYNMKSLSLKNSRILMYTRIFGTKDEDKCPDKHLEEVSNKILKKCDGVPLAINTISSLLCSKGRSESEWDDVCNSIGTGLEYEKDKNIENTRKVLSLSYYDMPSHLRTCLLYFSMFPEDYKISKDRLKWSWIAEGFIQSGNQRKSLFEVGESYINELINRSMVQASYDYYSGMIKHCHVHDMVLDLICFLSREENFITIRNHVGHPSLPGKVRRLSLQDGKVDSGRSEAPMSKEHVRSVVVFPPATSDHVPTLNNFKVLLVLDLEGCDLSQGDSLNYLGNLLHLRYLGLRNTYVHQLPKEIGNLRFLQTLDATGNEISLLPTTILQLTQLMCLRIDRYTGVPKGIGSLTALEELSLLRIGDDIIEELEELGHLTELKVLEITTSRKRWNNGLDKSLVECLNKLHKIQSLEIKITSGHCNLDGWFAVAPRRLRTLKLQGCWLPRLVDVWVDPPVFQELSFLRINVRGLQQEDLEILGRLPSLRALYMEVDHTHLMIHERFVVGAGSFPCLVRCCLLGFRGPLVFQHGAMPRVEALDFDFPVQKTREINGGFDLGLENLSSLQKVEVSFLSSGASEKDVKEAQDAVGHALEVHPNHPRLSPFLRP